MRLWLKVQIDSCFDRLCKVRNYFTESTFHNQGRVSSFSSRRTLFSKVPTASCFLSGPESREGWACSGLITSLSLFFFFLIDFFLQSSLATLEDQNSEQVEVDTLFSVNYFTSLGFLVGHFKWRVSCWVFYKPSPNLFSRDNASEKEPCDFQLSDKVFRFQLSPFPSTFTIKAAVPGLRPQHFLPPPNLDFAIPRCFGWVVVRSEEDRLLHLIPPTRGGVQPKFKARDQHKPPSWDSHGPRSMGKKGEAWPPLPSHLIFRGWG